MKKTVKLQRPKKERPIKPHASTLPKNGKGKESGEVTLDNDILL